MLMRMELPHLYEVAAIIEVPASSTGPPLRYCPAHLPVAPDSLLLSFLPQNSAAWIGSFAYGISGASALNLVLSSPDPLTAFVVAGGVGYAVQVNDPSHWQVLPVSPVMFVEVLPEQGMVVLGSGGALAVYDAKGLVWFKRVVESELKLKSISQGLIHFSGLDGTAGEKVSLSAVLDTGKEIDE